MYHFAIFTVLILGLQSDDAGLMSGGGCDPSNDPCFECYSCSEYGRCVPVIGCVASDPQMPEEPAVPEYPAMPQEPASESAEAAEEPQYPEAPAIPESPPSAPEMPETPESPELPQSPESEGRGSDFNVVFGGPAKGEGVAGVANTMGSCEYDGSLDSAVYDGSAQYYHAECTRLSMAECMTSGPSGRCVYVPAEGSAIGCIWDGTGCEVGCIPANMETRCAALSHDMESCEGADGQELRCKWSKAGADTMPGFGTEFDWPRDSSVESVAEGASEGAVEETDEETATDSEGAESASDEQSFPYPPMDDSDSSEEAPVEDAPMEEAPVEEAPVYDAPAEEAPVYEAPVYEAPVGDAPVYDAPMENPPMNDDDAPFGYPPMNEGDAQYGYPGDYPPRDQGADSYPYPPADQGAESYPYPPADQGAESYPYPPADQAAESVAIPEALSLFDKVHLFNMESHLSSRDIFLVVLLTVSGLVALYQLYRWCVNWKLHREYKLVNTSDRAARPSHCIIDGQAYF